MILSEVILEINELSDEMEETDIVLAFVNDAIAQINIDCDANYPFYRIEQQNESLPLPEKWIRTLIIPFGVGRLKQKDSSQFEYSDAYGQFLNNLSTFKAKYRIPQEYLDAEDQDQSQSDIYSKPALPWWRF